jgi:acyl phosphate:glycerol-3-phosphate acyltransferase
MYANFTVNKGKRVNLMIIFKFIGILLLGYCLGNISPSYLAGKWFRKIDIREHGSGNAGATNVIRVLGWRFGVPVFLLDMLKGFGAAVLGSTLGGELGAALAAIGVVIGHDFPVFLNFRGGKGIASTTGIFLFLFPVPALIAVLLFVLLVWATRMVSVGSLGFVTCMLIYTLASGQHAILVSLAAGLMIFAYYRHAANIGRILRGEENRLSLIK